MSDEKDHFSFSTGLPPADSLLTRSSTTATVPVTNLSTFSAANSATAIPLPPGQSKSPSTTAPALLLSKPYVSFSSSASALSLLHESSSRQLNPASPVTSLVTHTDPVITICTPSCTSIPVSTTSTSGFSSLGQGSFVSSDEINTVSVTASTINSTCTKTIDSVSGSYAKERCETSGSFLSVPPSPDVLINRIQPNAAVHNSFPSPSISPGLIQFPKMSLDCLANQSRIDITTDRSSDSLISSKLDHSGQPPLLLITLDELVVSVDPMGKSTSEDCHLELDFPLLSPYPVTSSTTVSTSGTESNISSLNSSSDNKMTSLCNERTACAEGLSTNSNSSNFLPLHEKGVNNDLMASTPSDITQDSTFILSSDACVVSISDNQPAAYNTFSSASLTQTSSIFASAELPPLVHSASADALLSDSPTIANDSPTGSLQPTATPSLLTSDEWLEASDREL
ncbi:unnamed protein product [Protopolystoma xenopodis]|uniref:Uncharacterized protein n=1 Tax=Protopolystoma xenopodis TaxID=117903 RepID=A0A448WFV1_9PLAT|nr:unnamed protein product [Protopolystoma xenopodis]